MISTSVVNVTIIRLARVGDVGRVVAVTGKILHAPHAVLTALDLVKLEFYLETLMAWGDAVLAEALRTDYLG